MACTKDAVRLYFQPVSSAAACLGNTFGRGQSVSSASTNLDPLKDLEQRLDQISFRITTTEQQNRMQNLRAVLRSSRFQGLAKLQEEVRRLETDLGIEKQLHPPPAKRTRGASGD